MACKRSWLGSALPCPAGRSVPGSRRTGAPEASATRRDRSPPWRGGAGPCWVRSRKANRGQQRAGADTERS
jgi:hypothetical protein